MGKEGDEALESWGAWENCKKNRGHKKFLPIQELTSNRLLGSLGPEDRQTLQVIIDRTVRLRVNKTSWERPDHDELSEHRGYDGPRVGTGFLWDVSETKVDQACPCEDCNGKVARVHWTFKVQTARHVVYNTEEARETIVDLFFDDETSDLDGRMKSVWALEVGWSNADLDGCSIKCVIHDEDLAERIAPFRSPRKPYYDKELPMPKELNLIEIFIEWLTRGYHRYMLIVSHPHGQPKKVTLGRMRGDIYSIDNVDYMDYYTNTCPGSSGAMVFPFYTDHRRCLPHHQHVRGFVHSGSCDRLAPIFRDQVNYAHDW